MTAGLFHGHRGLADPTQAGQHNLPDGRLGAWSLVWELGQELVAAGEEGVGLEGDGPDWRQFAWESGHRPGAKGRPPLGARELWLLDGFAAGVAGGGEQRRPRVGGVLADQVDVDAGREQAGRLDFLDPDWHEQSTLAGRILANPVRHSAPPKAESREAGESTAMVRLAFWTVWCICCTKSLPGRKSHAWTTTV